MTVRLPLMPIRFRIGAIALGICCAGTALAMPNPPVINEFVFNHTGTDDSEYVEVFGDGLTDYSDYWVLQIEGDSTVAGNVDSAHRLGISDPAGFQVPGFFFSTYENGTVTLLLVKNFTGNTGDDLDTDNDGVLDAQPWDSIADSVAVTDGGAIDRTYSTTVLAPGFDGNSFTPGGASRSPDGNDTDDLTDWVRNDFGLSGVKVYDTYAAAGQALNTPGKPVVLGPYTVSLSSHSIPEIQGAGHLSDHNFSLVSTRGVVTAVAFDGYYIQDPLGDGDSDTSDGIFVYEGVCFSCPDVGDDIDVEGLVHERIPGGAGTGNLSITTIFEPRETLHSTGNPLPASTIIGQSGRIPPNQQVIDPSDEPLNLQVQEPASFDTAVDGIDFFESLEGMLVTVDQPTAVSATRTFTSFSSEFVTLANDGADVAPADALNARGGIDLQPHPDNRGDQNPERVQIQLDGTLYPFPVPEVAVGDLLDDVTGVMGYSFGNFEVNALEELVITPASLMEEITTLAGDKKHVTVATYNVLNLSPDASDDDQRATIARHIVTNLGQPDVVALQEIQDNSGETNDGTTAADQTLQQLVDAIVAAGGPNYLSFDVAPADGTGGGIPGGNIRNAFLYDPARVSLVGFESLTPAALATYGVADTDAFAGTRNPLKATFKFRGKEFTVINNHLTSRFGSTPIFGGPQPFVQAGESEREAQTAALNQVAAAIIEDAPTLEEHASKAPRVIVLGDLNTFEFTDDLTDILPGTGGDQILWNLVNSLDDDEVYSYIFEGNSQVLDHLFVSELLVPVAEYDIVHVNVDFPRVDSSYGSDHEPSVVRLKLKN